MDKTLESHLESTENQHELLAALLFTAKNDWEAAHFIAQKKEGVLDYDRIHALLHRIEGDEFNAKYWYRRINEVYGKYTVAEEWAFLTKEFIEKYAKKAT
ncbi:MAG: hypothetical protein NWQ46_03665 [Spirosomaceae bacterium]|nr:hypothetical protein [Spirosomataceae bacterium]